MTNLKRGALGLGMTLAVSASLGLAPTATAAPVSQGGGYTYESSAGGTTYSSRAGTFTVSGAYDVTHRWNGGGTGALGYPVAPRVQQGGAFSYQVFERGVIYTSPSGTHAVVGNMDDGHRADGGGRGAAGYPVLHEISEGAQHQYQRFERGTAYTIGEHRSHLVAGAIERVHRSLGGGSGALGYPTGGLAREGGSYQHQVFERGVVYSSASGAFPVTGTWHNAHRGLGGGRGALGYPTTAATGQGAGYGYQAFEHGSLYQRAGVTLAVLGSLDRAHRAAGGGSGWLGYPTGGAVAEGGTHSYQQFERGTLYASPSGTYSVDGEIAGYHGSAGGGTGTLGYPTGNPARDAAGVLYQTFERGEIRVEDGRVFSPQLNPVPAGVTGNRALGYQMMLDYGFDAGQWQCLEKLWTKESGWNHLAGNRSSGAYGIPQSLPGGKMASAGPDWQTNPATQITWGLGYISGRYGTPCGAWSSFQSKGWY